MPAFSRNPSPPIDSQRVSETEYRRALILSEKGAQPDNPSLLAALDSPVSLLEDLQRHAEVLSLVNASSRLVVEPHPAPNSVIVGVRGGGGQCDSLENKVL